MLHPIGLGQVASKTLSENTKDLKVLRFPSSALLKQLHETFTVEEVLVNVVITERYHKVPEYFRKL